MAYSPSGRLYDGDISFINVSWKLSDEITVYKSSSNGTGKLKSHLSSFKTGNYNM